ncbi:MAG: IS21-like element helper ATPase IstB [Bacteroidota bacterium]
MNESTLEKMNQMKFYGMKNSLQNLLETNQHQRLTNDEFLSMLIQAEWEDRENRRINRYLKAARFRYKASVEEINFEKHRNLDKTQLLRLCECHFIGKGENLLITGPTGVGKSFIASAIGHQACMKGYRVLYFNIQKLFPQLRMLKADGSYLKQVNKIAKQDLLILDDFGLQPLDAQSRMMLLELIEDRHGKKSTIISSQIPVAKWYDIIGESTIADAILDRMVHTANRLNMKGQSLRKITQNNE